MNRPNLSWLDNTFVVVISSIIALTIVGLISFQIWNYAYSVSVAWVISDVALTLFVRGGGGWLKIPILVSDDFQNKGRGFLAFLIGIIAATWFSSTIADWILGGTGLVLANIPATNSTITPLLHVIASNPSLFTLLVANGVIAVLVFVDLNARFYKKS